VTEEEGEKALRILKTFHAVPAACPTVPSTSFVASPALSPNLSLTILVVALDVAERVCLSAASAASSNLSNFKDQIK
jgi:hypothetical protein